MRKRLAKELRKQPLCRMSTFVNEEVAGIYRGQRERIRTGRELMRPNSHACAAHLDLLLNYRIGMFEVRHLTETH